jgi:diguanylate cyclase (GGDEF)-like protein/PAS domain S-box-containing protein
MPMLVPTSQGRRLLAAGTAALVTLGLVWFAADRSSVALSRSSASVAHTHETLSQLNAAVAIVQEAENAGFAYFVMGDRSGLASVASAHRRYTEHMANLKQLLPNDAREMSRFRELKALGLWRLDEVRRAVNARRSRGVAQMTLRSSESRTRAARMRAVAQQMAHEERRRLAEGTRLAATRLYQMAVALTSLLALAVAFVTGFWVISRRELQRREHAMQAALWLGSIVDSSRDAIIGLSPDGAITSFNAAATELFGYREDEALGQPITILAPPGEPKTDLLALERVRATGRAQVYEGLRLARAGAALEVALTVSPVFDAAGAFTGASVIVRNIGPHREAERALRESQARFRVATDAMEEGLLLQDADGVIRLCNHRAAAMLGLTQEQMLGRSTHDLRWKAIRPDGTPLPAGDHPTMVSLRSGRAVHEEVIGMYRPDGSVVWLSVNAVPIFDGRQAGVVTTFTDVTERRLWRTALDESEQRFRSAIDHAPIGIGLMQTDGRWYRINESLCGMLGRAADDLINTPFRRLLRREDLHALLKQYRRLRAGVVDTCQIEVPFVHTAGRRLWALVTVSAIRDPNGVMRDLIVQVQDITERRDYEEAATRHLMELSEAHAELAAREHELREANRRLEALATEDALTGLKNYRHFRERLTDEFQRARRYNHCLTLILMDVDRFKAFNDTHGHLAGDTVLASVGALLREAVRDTDLVARYGGEEFVVILPHTDGSDGLAAAERLRRTLEATGRDGVGITASFGVASSNPAMRDANDLIAAADAALYESKSLGRNRVTLWRSEVAV